MSTPSPENDPSTASIGQKELYAATIAMMNSSESTSVSRFNAFLVVAGILAASWVGLATRTDGADVRPLMIAVSVFGIIAGVVWAGIGGRSRSYVELYRKIGERIESDSGSPLNHSPCTAAKKFEPVCSWKRLIRRRLELNTGASMLFYWLPLVVSVAFFCLLCITWRK